MLSSNSVNQHYTNEVLFPRLALHATQTVLYHFLGRWQCVRSADRNLHVENGKALVRECRPS